MAPELLALSLSLAQCAAVNRYTLCDEANKNEPVGTSELRCSDECEKASTDSSSSSVWCERVPLGS